MVTVAQITLQTISILKVNEYDVHLSVSDTELNYLTLSYVPYRALG